jgi:hypothetical protein
MSFMEKHEFDGFGRVKRVGAGRERASATGYAGNLEISATVGDVSLRPLNPPPAGHPACLETSQTPA